MTSEPEWKKFERAVHSEMENKFPGSTIRHDVRLPGALSGVARQIDIFIEEALPGGDVRTAVDAKQRARETLHNPPDRCQYWSRGELN
jgi:hypothetical protein